MIRSAIKSWKGFSVGGTSMLPQYRISLYSEGPKNLRGAGACFRVAVLYVWVAAGFTLSSLVVLLSVGT